MDVKKLRAMQKDLNNKAGSGDGLFLYSNKLGEEEHIRILPPPEEANGIYFVEQEGWWVDNKFYVANSTEILGSQEDIIETEIEAAKATKDKSLIALIEKKVNNIPKLKKEFRYLVPVLHLDVKYDDDDQLVYCKVDSAKVLVAKPTLIKAINLIVTGRQYQNKTEHGVADREKGYNLIIGKSGKGIDTEYSAMGWNEQTEMEEKYYEKYPNVHELTRKAASSQEHLKSVIRHYLYGEDIIADAKESEEEEEETATVATSTRPKKPTATAANIDKMEKVAASSKPKKPVSNKTASTKPTGKSLLDDVESDINDLD